MGQSCWTLKCGGLRHKTPRIGQFKYARGICKCPPASLLMHLKQIAFHGPEFSSC